jgi:hypothetical protein
MDKSKHGEAFILGAAIFLGLAVLGYFVSNIAISLKRFERTVTVKGLSEREMPANIAIWPIKFNEASNDLNDLFSTMENKTSLIIDFLKANGFNHDEISMSAPAILDRLAQGYVEPNKIKFRYYATSTITVFTANVDMVRKMMKKLVELGKKGIAIEGQGHGTKTEFLFTKLNEIKPQMIEEATKNAREVAEKFAKDSKSVLGKIKHARQGQFSIADRDSNTPYIKKVRVVSTVEYYLTD